MNVHSSHSNLGDCQWALNALHRMGGEHTLRCKDEYVDALRELVEGLPITIENCSAVPSNSRDFWIASGAYEREGVQYRDDIDILGFVAKYFNAMSREVGLKEPFPIREDMLCSFPSIQNYSQTQAFTGILVINCDPKSGQCPRYSSSEMDALIDKLYTAGHSVLAVEKAGLSLVQIGALSLHAKMIIGCATGPLWPCLNVWMGKTPTIVMLEPMRLDFGGENIWHAKDAADVEELLKVMDYL